MWFRQNKATLTNLLQYKLKAKHELLRWSHVTSISSTSEYLRGFVKKVATAQYIAIHRQIQQRLVIPYALRPSEAHQDYTPR